MSTTSLLANNPYRILGVYGSSSLKERISNKNRISAFLKVGKNISFPTDLNLVLGDLHRTKELVVEAESKINFPEGQLAYALFWLIQKDSFDTIAINHLLNGNLLKSKEIFQKRDSFVSDINLAVISLIDSDLVETVNRIFSILHNPSKWSDFVVTVSGEDQVCSTDDVVKMLTDIFEEEIGLTQLVEVYSQSKEVLNNERSIVKDKLGKKIQVVVKNEIERSDKIISAANSSKEYVNEALRFKSAVQHSIETLQSYFEISEGYRQVVCDEVAETIDRLINCASNEIDHSVNIPLIKQLLEYAQSISISNVVKEQLSSTIEAVTQLEEILCIKPQLDAIKKELDKASACSPDINVAEKLFSVVLPYLDQIQEKVGAQNKVYLLTSSSVVQVVMGIVVTALNNLQNGMTRDKILYGNCEAIFNQAVNLLQRLKPLPSSEKVRNLLDKNLSTIKAEVAQIRNAKIQTEKKQSSGCLIWILAGLVVLFLLNS